MGRSTAFVHVVLSGRSDVLVTIPITSITSLSSFGGRNTQHPLSPSAVSAFPSIVLICITLCKPILSLLYQCLNTFPFIHDSYWSSTHTSSPGIIPCTFLSLLSFCRYLCPCISITVCLYRAYLLFASTAISARSVV